MTNIHSNLLSEIEAFLAETGMGPSYFGKQACGNSEIVARLKEGRRVWPETETRVRAFILSERRSNRSRAPAPKEAAE